MKRSPCAAGPADAAEIAALIQEAFESHRGRLHPSPGALKETAESIARRLAQERALVAEAERRIGACIFMTLRSAEELYVGRLAVLPSWRGRGVARRLVEAAERVAVREGRRALSLSVRAALTENIAVFERLGFRQVGRRPHPDDAATILMDMVKAL